MSSETDSPFTTKFLNDAHTFGDAFSAIMDAYLHHEVAFGHGFEDAEHETHVLLQHAWSESDGSAQGLSALFADDIDGEHDTGFDIDAPLEAHQRQWLERALHERLVVRRPLPYILKEAWQGDFPFYVDERVLIPRSFIADLLMDGLAPWIAETESSLAVLDLCCGSGCLGIIAAHTLPNVETLFLADISSEALEVARINVNRYFIDQKKPKVTIAHSDVFNGLHAQRFDLIISNPPYVTTASMQALPAEYRHEPSLALAAGDQGLSVVRRILSGAHQQLRPGGLLVVEVGNNQGEVLEAWPDAPFTWVDTPNAEGAVFVTTREDLAAWR